jgi:iron complex outermembrane receptor protein
MAQAQPTGKKITINGKALDEDGNPIELLTVIGNRGEHFAETGANGAFTLYLNPADTLVIEFRSLDYEPYTEKVVPKPGERSVSLTVRLTSKVVTMGVVTVSERFSERIEKASVSMAVVQPKQIQVFAPTNLKDVLQQMPGVTMVGEQISMRGSSGWTYGAGSRVVGLLNGMPMMPAERGAIDYDFIPVDIVQQVEVIKGSSSVLYGTGALGGVINVITKTPTDKPETVVRARVRMYDAPRNPRADFDGRSSLISHSVHATHSRKILDTWEFTMLADYIKNYSFRQDERDKRFRLMAMNRFNVKAIPGLSVGLNAQWALDSTSENLFWVNYPEKALVPNPDFRTNLNILRYHVDPSISYTRGNTTWQYQGRVFNRQFLYTPDTAWKDENRSGYTLINRNIGALAFYNDVIVKHSLWSDRLQVVEGLNYTRTWIDGRRDFGKGFQDQLAAFAQARLELGRLSLTLGARWQFEQISGDTTRTADAKGLMADSNQLKLITMNQPVFRAGLNYRAHKATFLRASFGQAVRSPSAIERFTSYAVGPITILPNPDIRLERGWTAEVGVRQLYEFGSRKQFRGYLDLCGFTQQFRDMIEFWVDTQYLLKQGKTGFKATNLSRASVSGVEGDFALEWKARPDFTLALTSGFTWIRPVDEDGKKSWDGDDSSSVITDAFVQAAGLADPVFGAILQPMQEFPQDRPYTLKYRNTFTTRSALNLEYKWFTLTVNHRYTSFMENVDKLLLVDLLGANLTLKGGTKVPLTQQLIDQFGFGRLFQDTKQFRQDNPGGWHEFDLTAGYRNDHLHLTFHVFNLTNVEYTTLPGRLGAQRSFAIQAKFTF